ncbi:MAG: CHAT domain-containing protein [Planctomycetaceae bacterium]
MVRFLPLLATYWLFAVGGSSGPVHGQLVVPPGLGATGSGTVPGPDYDTVFVLLAEGRVDRALELAADRYRGGVRIGATRWVDSIPSAMAVGECHWELGQLREAVRAYDEALLLYAAHGDWLLGIRFPAGAPTAKRNAERVPWGPGTRNLPPSIVPETMPLRRGGGDADRVLKQGGVLTAAADYPVRPLEIVRGLLVSLYRRGDIIGSVAIDGEPLAQAVRSLARRAAPPNHYSHAWVDLMLGTAYWAQGRVDQATPLLERGLTMPGPMDHALTGWGLILLGRIRLAAGDAAGAARLFDDASIAAYNYSDFRCLEEAFQWSVAAHLAAGERRVPAILESACAWARSGPTGFQARLNALRACGLAETASPDVVRQALAEIDPRNFRGELAATRTAVLASYAAAVASLHEGRPEAMAQLEASLAAARPHNPRLFQTQRLTEAVASNSGALSDREIDLLFASLLGDPPSAVIAAEPIGSLTVMTTPRTEGFEAWVMAASRRGTDPFLQAVESRSRSRWLTARPIGGRLMNIDRLLETDRAELEPEEEAARLGVLAAAPDLARLIDRSNAIRTELLIAMNAAAAPLDVPGDVDQWQSYGQLIDRQTTEIVKLTVGRRQPKLSFPPLFSAEDIRSRLEPGRLILSFHWNASGLVGVLESRERVAVWQIRRATELLEDLRRLARGLCLFESAAPATPSRLVESDWLVAAERLERTLFEDSKISLAEGIEELTIVPDGLLWYLPFELLPIASTKGAVAAEDTTHRPPRLLRDCCRIRYSATRSLAVWKQRPVRRESTIGLLTGRLHRAESPEAAEQIRERLASSFDRTLTLPVVSRKNDGQTTSLAASLVDVLVVLDAVSAPSTHGNDTRPQRGAQRQTAFDLGAWGGPPLKRASCVLIPGFDSAMSFGLQQFPARPGDDLFMSAVDLAAVGATTAVLSRWSMGGMTMTALMDEVLREQGHARDAGPGGSREPSEAWRRSVDLAMREEPDLTREPRIRPDSKGHLADASHPLFWAGYMLLDCGTGSDEEAIAVRP